MEELLEKLLKIAGVQGALVVGKDGLVIASVGHFAPDADSFGATVAEVLNQLDSSFSSQGAVRRLTMDQESATLHATAINEVTYLVVQAASVTNLGRVRLDSDQVTVSLREQL